MGFSTGIFVGCLLASIYLLQKLDFFSTDQNDFIKYQFPIFRGTLMIFLYWFFLGLNVYVWEKYNINYKRVFQIQMHHSSPYQIFRRVSIFMAIWMVIFLYSATAYIYKGKNFPFLIKGLELYLPPLIWVMFFLYMLLPSK